MAEALPTGDLVARALAEAGGQPILTLNRGHNRGPYLGAEAITTALAWRTGPAFLDVPIDVLFQSADPPERRAAWEIGRGELAFADDVRRIAALIREAVRPAIVAGSSVWWSRAEEELARLAESAGIPVVLNGMARGMLPPDHPLFASRARGVAMGEADLLLVVGVPLDFRLNFGQPPLIAADARLVYLDVDDFRKHRPAAPALYGD